MQKDSVADVLRSLATGDKSRSETARLRDVFPEVETALNAGVSRAAILEALHGQGFTMTLKSFESALYRIRKQQAKTGAVPPRPASLPPLATTNEAQQPRQPLAGESESKPDAPDDSALAGLDAKQRREAVADRFIKPETNALFRRKKENQ